MEAIEITNWILNVVIAMQLIQCLILIDIKNNTSKHGL